MNASPCANSKSQSLGCYRYGCIVKAVFVMSFAGTLNVDAMLLALPYVVQTTLLVVILTPTAQYD